MSEGTSSSGSVKAIRTFRNYVCVFGLLLLIVCCVPPFWGWSQRYEYIQAMQFISFSVLIPALFVVGAPWRWIGLASSQPPSIDDDGHFEIERPPRLIDRYVLVRPRQTSNVRAIWLMVAFIALTIFWRAAPVLDFTVRHGWVVVFESLSTLVVGVVLWTDLVESPPLSPGATRPYRIGMSAVAMWAIWVLAYLDAMSHSSWYSVFITSRVTAFLRRRISSSPRRCSGSPRLRRSCRWCFGTSCTGSSQRRIRPTSSTG